MSSSVKAGVVFPVGRIGTKLKNAVPWRVTKSAAAYLAAVLEFVTGEVLELAGNAAKDFKTKRIMPKHIQLGIAGDDELAPLLAGNTVGGSGRTAEQRNFTEAELEKWGKGNILTPNS